MGRRKKVLSEESEAQKENERMHFNIHSDAKRSAAAVFLFSIAVLFIFGFFDGAGVLGKYLNKIGGAIFGWGKWLFPLVLVIAGIVLLLRKKTSYYVTKITGLFFAFLSVLGFFHIFFDADKFSKIAKAGEGGGYIGMAIAYILSKFTGQAAGIVILVAIFLIGIIIAFNFSLVALWQRLFSSLGKKEYDKSIIGSDDYLNEDIEDIENANKKSAEIVTEEINDKSEIAKIPAEEDLGNNIKKIEFVSGSDDELRVEIEGEKEEKNKKIHNKDNFQPVLRKDTSRRGFASRAIGNNWDLPPLRLLENSSGKAQGGDTQKKSEVIKRTFSYFGIEVEEGGILVGPTVTQYSFRPAVGVKLSRITALGADLSLALAAHPIRIEAPIPGKSMIGIEVPNKTVASVRMRDALEDVLFRDSTSTMNLILGKNVGGKYISKDLRKMPHLLVAGATGTGKSVCINSILISLLYQNTPDDLKLVLVDPKRVELSLYNGIPHLLSDVIVENSKVINVLKWAIGEMEQRYRLLQDTGSRDLVSYHLKFSEGKKRKFIDPETGVQIEEDLKKLPYIVIVIDELADLMAAHGKEVEGAIIRLAQMARAIGIHLIVSTQRPSVEVLTGLIKANITTRIALQVATQIDSRTILDMAGAEKLLGRGDMLFLSSDSAKPLRVQGVLIDEEEVKRVVKFWKRQKDNISNIENNTDDEVEDKNFEKDISSIGNLLHQEIDFSSSGGFSQQQEDNFYEEAKRIVIESGRASASLLQRRLRVGYNRAARLVDMLEENGVIGPSNGSKPRELLTENALKVQSSDKFFGQEDDVEKKNDEK
ncbi:MAG: Cell division FtsK/SpoIIIE [Candidatus Moranbacteria bacterium GW2011_GWE2_35_2-]|nr:MAG: Cell division FtsK/SpoIIIE [Candidatus Moranbacteria bacterium GW2011_GWE2_35_2-]KKQ06199.1 MAG: Cell division FtsK/SpoIIIE [Candidatus Moranbacteria bacterium GW2011_GWF1_36_4]KKQ22291.1 MAG: Cell division FtsK/SpoIIIE [Candidatus Moranbacteria bacterium GW2011_GWF2_37_11]KKQ28519.1 MAG: Cell division FtsK/SpoIIIE [Candidatus Moranbacteria bacterium GW2011_GWD1_37_17]KKQ30217.1 MAG: Cell division FtsK/SpoIIIE [Candidatus Moranbacteria bacterium GW2011_GWE1_37_24]KKQ47635.1 MAG: Cell d